MCLLTFMPEYTTASIDDLTTSAENNPDGFGFAIHDGRRIIHDSGLNFDAILDKFITLRQTHNGPALFHTRITTHGGTTNENCHPFQVGKDELTVVAHNGMLPIQAKNGKSDTRIFAEELFPSWGGASLLNSKKMRKKLAKFATGSKLVFLSANPNVQNDFTIINEKDGHYDANGVWWSNNSYKYSRYSYSGAGMYTTGWSKSSSGIVTPQDDYDYGYDEQEEYDAIDRTPNVIDCSYVDRYGNQVWQEYWQCSVCDYGHMFDESNINMADLCPQCDACWFCENDRLLCECYIPQTDVVYKSELDFAGTHSIRNYDSTVDHF